MMAALDELFTDRRLNQGLIEQALAVTGAEPVPVLGRYVAHVTGGSSGQRGVFVYDRCAKAGFLLSLMRSFVARLAGAGGPPPGGLTIAMVAASSAVHPTGAAAAETARYELTDTFVREPGTPGPGHLHARMQGRSDEVFRYPGGDLHPHVIRSVLLRAPEVADYQVRQTRSGIDVDIIAAGTAGPEALRSQLAAALAGAGLSDPSVTVRIAGDLARNPHSGKVQRFVPLATVSSR